jgi:cytoskeletal protein CcmA (bactofilin family)
MAMLNKESNLSGEIKALLGPGTDYKGALLGQGAEFEGKLTFEGEVTINGKFNGSIITEDRLVVGKGARLNAEVTCGVIVVEGGEVIGNIRAKNAVELRSNSRVRGNIETPSLTIEKGVMFEGQTKMENLDKTSGNPKPASLPPTPLSV